MSHSTTTYASNEVIIQSSETSSEAGTLDLSSAVNFAMDNLKVYNVNFENAYGAGSQVNFQQRFILRIPPLINS